MKKQCNHDWRRDWSDGRIGRTVCTKCQTGVLVTVGDHYWWTTKAKEQAA